MKPVVEGLIRKGKDNFVRASLREHVKQGGRGGGPPPPPLKKFFLKKTEKNLECSKLNEYAKKCCDISVIKYFSFRTKDLFLSKSSISAFSKKFLFGVLPNEQFIF